ncbi:TetR/AcrR family transcriptional regulator [Nocardia crassostreae]|uniref:TetR/AcrR family transcriptional regulator n=1 Tax=Nocardia crassostreae TaxID=53428 RepID=UPI00083257E2|nr:TetR/AcrR family transcriptional regulator [Nocardia crassostreae]
MTAPPLSRIAPEIRAAAPNSRADARRNRALVLAAAQRAFAEVGTSVSLSEIARRAGVGAGTVHRHFPSKDHLLEAVLQQRIDRLTALAVGYRDAPDAGVAFFAFCTEVVTSTPGNQALCEVFDNDGWPRDLLREAGERFHRALTRLLTAAQRQGAVRADLTLGDVLAIFTGCVAIQRLPNTPPGLARPAALILDALRSGAPDPAVTKPGTRASRHNETRPRNETAAAHCPICATPLRHTGAGRPARYCSPACRQKAHRRRHATSAVAAGPAGQ